jgi:ribosomal protein S18 acetylase RimI-like enzyme
MTQAPPLSSVQAFVCSNIASGVPQFVALVGDEVVGWCDISPSRYEGFTHVGELGMGVRKDLRGQGIGTRLLDATLARVRACGLERVELEVYSLNEPAIRLYEKRGFVVEGVKKGARKLDGA